MLSRMIPRAAARSLTAPCAFAVASRTILALRSFSQKPPQDPATASDPASSSSDLTPPPPEEDATEQFSPRARKPDGLPRSAYISSTDRRRNSMFQKVSMLTLIAGAGLTFYLGRELDEEEKQAHPTIGQSWSEFFARTTGSAFRPNRG